THIPFVAQFDAIATIDDPVDLGYGLAHIGFGVFGGRMIFRTCGMAAGISVATVAVAAMVTQPVAHADDLGLGDVLSDFVVGASTAELANHAVDQALAASASGAETLSAAGLFQQYIYDPLHAGVESWINSSFGEQVDHAINLAAGQFLIGNGADGTALDPNGGDGGLWFGDGGNGWDSTQPGEAGGSGGDAVGFLGSGGEGGAGGAGAAGGNAGVFGEHGMVGDYAVVPTIPTEGGLTTSGDWLTNSDGQVVLLHGLNEV